MQKVELLAPAGNFNKLKVVFNYGADAAYLGGKAFSLRAGADNFTHSEIEQAVKYAHERGKKIYVAVNIFAKNKDLQPAADFFKFLQRVGADAAIITDAGLIDICKEVAPNLPIHLSTQANTLNRAAAAFWAKQGVSRIILARELSLAELKETIDDKNFETEIFIHGAMCVSYSGRCLLSNYLSQRDANRGECVQACRWNFKMHEVGRADKPIEVCEDESGTYFMNSKDLRLLEHIPSLVDAGVKSFKIEGRMKSEFYLAATVNAYRRAIDEYYSGGKIENLNLYINELNKVSNRGYTDAYLMGDNQKTINYNEGQQKNSSVFTAFVLEYHEGFAKVEMRNRFKVGDVLTVLSNNNSFNKTFKIETIVDENGTNLDDCKLVQQIVKINCPYQLGWGDILKIEG